MAAPVWMFLLFPSMGNICIVIVSNVLPQGPVCRGRVAADLLEDPADHGVSVGGQKFPALLAAEQVTQRLEREHLARDRVLS